MSNPAHIQSFLDNQIAMLLAVDEELNAWKGEGCLQFPILMGNITVKLGWDSETQRKKEPIIREYVRNHPDWYVTRGAHGGIMRRSEKEQKDAAKAAKEKAKAELNAALEAEVARKKAEALAQQQSAAPASVEDNTNIASE